MEWLKKILCNIWFYVVLILVSLIAPIIINELYRYGQTNNIGYSTLWGATDALAFLGSYLSFFGTIVLGAVAIFQTDRANKLAEKSNDQTDIANDLARTALAQAEKANELSLQMQKLEQARFYSIVSLADIMISIRDAKFPNFINTHMRDPKMFDLVNTNGLPCHSCYHVDFTVINESEIPIDFIKVKCSGQFENTNYGVKETSESVYIAPRNKYNIRLIIPTTYFLNYNDYIVHFNIYYQNIFGYETHVQINIDNISDTHDPKYTYQFQRILNTSQNETTTP